MTREILAIGDPHFKLDNVRDVNIFISELEKLIITRKPHTIIVLGDLLHYHERVIISCLNLAYSFLKMLRKYAPVYVLVGNHDMEDHTQFLTENHWMNGIKLWGKQEDEYDIKIIDKTTNVTLSETQITLIPYVYPGRFKEALDTNPGWKKSKIIFSHQEFFGCNMGAIKSEIGDKWELNNPFIVSGHIHDRQIPQSNIYYVGSSLQHAFGESNKKVIALIDLDIEYKYNQNEGGLFKDSICGITEIMLSLPQKKIINTSIADISKKNIEISELDKLRLTIKGNFEEFKAFKKSNKYKDLIDKGVKIVYRKEKIQAKNKVVKCSFEEILESLVNSENNPDLLTAYNYIFKEHHKDDEILIL